jgi:hypothetical protein
MSSGQRGPDVVVENEDEDEGEVVKPAWKDLLDGELHESLYKIGLEGVCEMVRLHGVGVVFRYSAFRTAPKSSTMHHASQHTWPHNGTQRHARIQSRLYVTRLDFHVVASS